MRYFDRDGEKETKAECIRNCTLQGKLEKREKVKGRSKTSKVQLPFHKLLRLFHEQTGR